MFEQVYYITLGAHDHKLLARVFLELNLVNLFTIFEAENILIYILTFFKHIFWKIGVKDIWKLDLT